LKDTIYFLSNENIKSDSLHNLIETVIIRDAPDKQPKENPIHDYIPLIGVLLGAVIAFFTQFFIKKFELKKNHEKEQIEIQRINDQSIEAQVQSAKQNLIQHLNDMHFFLHELAYLKVDSEFQEYQISTSKSEYLKNKATDEVYKNYEYSRAYLEKIYNCYSKVFVELKKLTELKGLEFRKNIQAEFHRVRSELTRISTERTSSYKSELNEDQIDTKKDVGELYKKYSDIIKNMEDLVEQQILN
jgi:hypothetical protein